MLRPLRYWLIEKLAGSDAIVLNTEIGPDPLLYIPWQQHALILNNRFSILRTVQDTDGFLLRLMAWLLGRAGWDVTRPPDDPG